MPGKVEVMPGKPNGDSCASCLRIFRDTPRCLPISVKCYTIIKYFQTMKRRGRYCFPNTVIQLSDQDKDIKRREGIAPSERSFRMTE